MSEQNRPLRAENRPKDKTRVIRALLAFRRGDQLALNAVLNDAETDEDKSGPAGMLLTLLDMTVRPMTDVSERNLEAALLMTLDRQGQS